MAYLRNHDFKAGRSELERAVSLKPGDPNAVYNLGMVLLDLGQPEQALQHLRQARTLSPERPDVAFNIIRAELEEHRSNDARRDAEAMARTFGTEAEWRVAVGREFAEHGLAREAIAHLKEALRLRPDSDEVRHLLARADLDTRAAQEALDLISNPRSAEDHYLRARALYLLHRLKDADGESVLAVQEDPRQPRYLLLRARLLQVAGNHDFAFEFLRQATRLAPDWSEVYYSAGVSFYFESRYEEARQSLDRALDLDPRSARSWFLYSATLVNQGKNREAEVPLRHALAIEPENARFFYHLGALLLRDNRPEEARAAFETSVRLKPGYALPHYQLGKLLARSNQVPAAIRELELAVQEQPNLAQAYFQLGRAYASLGEKEKSQRAFEAFARMKKQGEEEEDTEDFSKEVREQLDLPVVRPPP
jgi:tetratricopeptide (TPR) repeat protein